MDRKQSSTLTCAITRRRHDLRPFLVALLVGALPPPAQQPMRAQNAVELGAGHAIEGEIAPGQTQTYDITLRTGQFARLTIEQPGNDLVERVLGPARDLVARFDSAWDSQDADRVEFVAESSGVYRIEVSAKLKRASCPFRIFVDEIGAAGRRESLLHESNRLATRFADLYRAGQNDAAAIVAEQALDAGERALGPNHAHVVRLLRSLAEVQRQLGDYLASEASFRRALAVSERVVGSEHPLTGHILERFGALYVVKEEYGKAAPMLQQALRIAEQTVGVDHSEFASALTTLAALHIQMADFEQAERELDRGLTILERTRDPNDPETARILTNLGNLYLRRKEFGRADSIEQRALTMYEALDGPEAPSLVFPLLNLGRIAHERPTGRDLDRALQMYQRGLAIAEKAAPRELNVAIFINNMANVYKAKHDYDTPLDLYRRVLRISEETMGPYHNLTIVSLGNIANLYIARRDIPNAIEFQQRVDERLEQAFALNLAIGSERQKLAYFQSYTERTERTVSLHLRLAPRDPAAAALAALVLLQRKGRVLDAASGTLTAARLRFDTTDQALLDRLNLMRARLARLALDGPPKTQVNVYWQQFRELEEQKERLEAEMSGRSTEFRASSPAVTLAAVQAAIPPNAALIEFAVYRPFDPAVSMNSEQYGQPRYAVCVMHRDGRVQWSDLGDARDTDRAVDQLRRALRDPRRSDVRERARVVDERVMQPVRAMIGDADHLLVSPDGVLNLIPFEALVDENRRYLVQRYSFTYLTSGRDLLRLQMPRASRSGPVVIADPSFGERTGAAPAQGSVTSAENLANVYFAPLSGTARESREIEQLFPEAKVYTRDQATESVLKRVEAPSILHIATHGFFLSDRPTASADEKPAAAGHDADAALENPLLRSGLALAGANRRSRGGDDDGVMTALEASGLDLWGTKLVTLSACDSGIGQVMNGEGVYGLRRAFVLAGAETLVMSLWPVSDDVTRELMTGYYGRLKRGAGRGQALREVQLDALSRKNRSHPFYWAGFIQAGEWTALEGPR